MDGWEITFILGNPIFRGYASFREGKRLVQESLPKILGNLVGDEQAFWGFDPNCTPMKTNTEPEHHPEMKRQMLQTQTSTFREFPFLNLGCNIEFEIRH